MYLVLFRYVTGLSSSPSRRTGMYIVIFTLVKDWCRIVWKAYIYQRLPPAVSCLRSNLENDHAERKPTSEYI